MGYRLTLRQVIHSLFKDIRPPVTDGMQAYAKDSCKERGELAVTRICSHPGEVVPGAVFVAISGSRYDGHLMVREAIERGAVLVVGERRAEELLKLHGASLPDISRYLSVKDSRLALSALAAMVYQTPTQNMRVIGITGTSGKTTLSYLLESIFQSAGFPVGVIGTVNYRFNGKPISGRSPTSGNTTPGPLQLQAICQSLLTQGGAKTVLIMEVSSHALAQHRVAHVAFDAVGFTNLSPEHLDYHHNLETYYQAKRALFFEQIDFSVSVGKRPVAIINGLDKMGRRLVAELQAGDRVKGNLKVVCCDAMDSLVCGLDGISGFVGPVPIQSQLIGTFNRENLFLAATLAQELQIPANTITAGLNQLTAIPGRLERVSSARGPLVLVDYAHKPDALAKVLQTLQAVRVARASLSRNGACRLITVFGCGGNRDRVKRPVMGAIAVAASDFVIVTSDNPRLEDPMAIIDEIVAGMGNSDNFRVEVDRKRAIERAICVEATDTDIVVIAGKGHEDNQLVADPARPGELLALPFSDRDIAQKLLAKR